MKVGSLFILLNTLLFFSCTTHTNSSEKIEGSSIGVSSTHVSPDSNAAGKGTVSPIDTPSIDPDKLIVPGKRIGKTHLGLSAQELGDLLGKPDKSDAAMGKAWMTWLGEKRDEHNNQTELDIYVTYNDGDMRMKTVQQIRVTSAYFETDKGLGVYRSLHRIKQNYPDLRKVAYYQDGGRTIDVYDDVNKGIAFEVTKAGDEYICTGVIVHLPGTPVMQTYIYLHPETTLLHDR